MTSFTEVLSQIAPQQTEPLTFVGQSLLPQQRIFGGQVVAQCLMAANQTVAESLNAHSLHAYFLRAGDPTVPIDFEVDPIRDGRSFSTRRVVARQNARPFLIPRSVITVMRKRDPFFHDARDRGAAV